MQVSQNNFYPGMQCDGVEFFNLNSEVKFIQAGEIKSFSYLESSYKDLLLSCIDREAGVKESLSSWHPNNKDKQLEQFVSCRFGGIDFHSDIKNNILQDGEYHSCPNHGSCKFEGVLCKLPNINGERLSSAMVKLMKLLSTDYTNPVIAEKMSLPEGTCHLLKKKLYALLGVQTKQEVALVARSLNLV